MPQKVLIVDDSPTVRQIMRTSLQDEPLDLFFASSGTEGLDLARSSPPDLILLDVEMPPPDGFEICRQLKLSAATAGIPVIFLTKRSSTDEKVTGLDLGAIDYISKPFESAELRARVRATLRAKRLSDVLEQKAMIDGLTGVWNRSFFDQRLAQEISLASRYGSELSLILGDVDRFKSINDARGHPFGDQVLRNVANAIVSCCRKEDSVCRYGGEEFAVLSPRISLIGAVALAERVRQKIAERVVTHRGAEISVTCSFGVSQLSSGKHADLVDDADVALYLAKKNGRNRVVVAGDDPRRPSVEEAVLASGGLVA